MANKTYDSYYLPRHREQPPEYYYNHPTTAVETATCLYDKPSISISGQKIPPIHIPQEKRHINTLFVSGLPDDVLPREIHNLFRRQPGFDSCLLEFTGRRNQVVAFVTFFDHHSAVLALQALHGIKFDPQDGSILHLELARSNSRRKRKSGSRPYVVIDKRRKAAYDAEDMSGEDGDNELDTSGRNGDPKTSDDDAHSTEKCDEKKAELKDPEAASNKQTEKISGDLQPCSTLFIANLGLKCSEQELKEALSQYPGFNGLRFQARRGAPVAFADYEEVEQATNAMQALQNSSLASSDQGGMLIEYARSKMRKP